MKPKGTQRLIRYVLGIAVMMVFSCDPFQEDFIEKEKSVVFSNTEYYILPGSAVVIDLESIIKEAFTNATLKISQNPSRGQLSHLDALLLRYQPNSDFQEGKDEFVFSVLNNGKLVKKETIAIFVKEDTEGFPCSLIAVGDIAPTKPDSTITVAVLINDRLCGIDISQLQLSIHIQPKYGEAVISGDSIKYTVNSDFQCEDEIVYKITARATTGNENITVYGIISITAVNGQCQSAWATYYGGNDGDGGTAVTVDAHGNIFLVGNTSSTVNIASQGSHQAIYGGGEGDAYLVKFNSLGARQWATYYGGSGSDVANSLAVDLAGNIYIAGRTTSTTGITTQGSHQVAYGGGFLAKFTANGNRQWATYYGGGEDDYIQSIAIDPNGNIYAAGQTYSTTGIATNGSHQSTHAGIGDAFLVKFNSNGVRQWATYYGGNSSDYVHSVATDVSGNVYLSGSTISESGIATSGSYQDNISGAYGDAFLVKFNANGVRQWATYYGGVGDEWKVPIAVDINGNVYLAGSTTSDSNIATLNSHQDTFIGGGSGPFGWDAFLVKFNANGVRQWATYYGGGDFDQGNSIAVDFSGNVYLTGETYSASDIATTGSYQETHSGGSADAFLVKFNTDGVRQWGTYFGASGVEWGNSTAVDPSGNICFTGWTASTSGIATLGSHQNIHGGGYADAFLVKLIRN